LLFKLLAIGLLDLVVIYHTNFFLNKARKETIKNFRDTMSWAFEITNNTKELKLALIITNKMKKLIGHL